MSTRYVWEKSNYELINAGTITSTDVILSWDEDNTSPTIYYSKKAEKSGNQIVLAGTIKNEKITKAGPDEYPSDFSGSGYAYITLYGNKYPEQGLYYGTLLFRRYGVGPWVSLSPTRYTLTHYSGYGKTSKIGTVSNASSSTYPQDGVSGNYWYELQGSDNIDAAAVGYSNQAPMGGQPITINVTAGTGKVYGGNVRYTYQVQLNGGSWQTIATNSTALSQSYTIPAGTTSFAARVQASDDLGFTSSTYTTGTTLTVTNNVPPTAPSGISFTEPVAGSTCDITWGAATDSDGTVTGYELERNVDGGDSWTQIYSGSALSYEDNVDPDWATVNYRVRAVDDDGDKGAYATGAAQAVNDGWLYFSGPDEYMGAKSSPFDFAFAINSTPAGAQGVDVHVYLDDDEVYSGTPNAGEQVSVHVDMRPMRSGEHVIVTTAECGELLGLNKVCKFTVPEFALPDGGYILQLRDSDGVPIFPHTLVSAVKGAGNQSVAGILEQSYYSTYVGTGTSGQGNPCQTRLAFHPSLMIIQASGNSAAAIGYWVRTAAEDSQDQGNMVVYNGTTQTLIPVRWDEETMTISYYGNSAAEQLNASGVVYGIRIL